MILVDFLTKLDKGIKAGTSMTDLLDNIENELSMKYIKDSEEGNKCYKAL